MNTGQLLVLNHLGELADRRPSCQADVPGATFRIAHSRSGVGAHTFSSGASLLPSEVVYAGLSVGAMPAQKLAHTRPRAKGAALLHAAPPGRSRRRLAGGLPLRVPMMEDDEFALEGDLEAARELEETVEGAEPFLYPGHRHLFTDSTLAAYADDVRKQRVVAFIDGIEELISTRGSSV